MLLTRSPSYRDRLSYWNRGSIDVILGDWDAGRRCYTAIFTAVPGAQGNLPAQANDRADVMKIGYGSAPNWCPI